MSDSLKRACGMPVVDNSLDLCSVLCVLNMILNICGLVFFTRIIEFEFAFVLVLNTYI